MADSGAARRRRTGEDHATRDSQTSHHRRHPPGLVELDSLIHHRMRLGIVSALAADESMSFNELKAVLHTTDGNLSVHARKLEEAQYITCSKRFEARRPHTEYRLTATGRRALQRYLDHMEAIIDVTRLGMDR